MKEYSIDFTEINRELTPEFINELGNIHVVDESIGRFFIKTVHTEEHVVFDDTVFGGCRTVYEEKYNTMFMTVCRTSNDWLGVIDGNFAFDYTGYTVTHIAKINID